MSSCNLFLPDSSSETTAKVIMDDTDDIDSENY